MRAGELSAGRLALLLNAPALAGLFLVLAYPICFAGYLSLHTVSIRELRSGEFPFAGLANFARLLADPVFWLALRHTFVFVAASVLLEVLIGLAIALVISDERVWLLWSFILNAQFGYLNRVLHKLGLISEYINWLGHPWLAMGAVVAAYVWRTTPFNVLLYHAALQGIPATLYEAAAVDGASPWQSLWQVTLPLLRPMVAVTLILRTTFGFMVFDEILAITQGGPGNDTWVAAWYTYRRAFQPPFDIGLGAASAWILAIIVGLIALAYVRLVYRRVEYA